MKKFLESLKQAGRSIHGEYIQVEIDGVEGYDLRGKEVEA